MKTTFTLGFLLLLNTLSAQGNCTELFISEYVEGWSNNKALEIYNPTSQAINLSGYFVSRYSNGSTSATVATQFNYQEQLHLIVSMLVYLRN
jgi:predicted extracellular nuclease